MESKNIVTLDQKISHSDLVADTEEAIKEDHELGFFRSVQLYPKAIAWSMAICAASIMDGYDLHVVGLLFAVPAFRTAYGDPQPDGSRQISAPWQSGLNNGSNIGQLAGLFLAGLLSERLGFRKTLMIALVLTPFLILIQFFAPSLVVLEIGQILLGIPMGLFQTTTIVYAAEVAPTSVRPMLTSWASQMWVLGQILAAVVGRSVLGVRGSWAYRIPFAVQWFWPIPVFIAVFFAPESPWWLVRQRRLEDAKKSLRRLTSDKAGVVNIDKTVALMLVTTEHERELNASRSYAACFKGTDFRRTSIVVALYCMQIAAGSTLRAYATYFFEQAGLASDWSFNLSIITYVLSFVGTVWFLMPHVGRRTLFIWGMATLNVIYFIIGGLAIPAHQSSLSWGIASLLVINGFVAYVCIEPIVFALGSEVPSMLLRSKSVAVGRLIYAVFNIAANVLTTYQINPSAWNWGAKTGFFWGGFGLLALVYSYLALPETKDKTFAELDYLFEHKVPARKFAKTQVHPSEIAAWAQR
ncbi:hypothetical protein AYO22_04855 [Fonsecaea multimorphosa]|nr:hypothetical protein AYO22_04855 [Fonsecaea multimorphosa]